MLHLPSLPTRRSSDLCEGERKALHERDPAILDVSARRGDHERTEPDALLLHGPRDCEVAAVVVRRRELEDGDRKSTRLNSSHLVISYAVFCLKKKKNI